MKAMMKGCRTRAVLLMAVAVFAVLYVPLVCSTERWRVGGNDIIPHFETWRQLLFGTGPRWYLIASGFGFHVALLSLSLLSGFLLVRFKRLRVLVVVALVGGFLGFRYWAISSRLELAVVSCANHAAFWGPLGYPATAPLPDSTEFYDFLAATRDDAGRHLPGLRCPGYKWTGTKTGVAFVGAGLDLSSVTNLDALIAFCSSGSHPPPHDHQHYLVWYGTASAFHRECAPNLHKMIDVIDRAIAQGESGQIPYTPEAMEILQLERARRERLANQTGVQKFVSAIWR